MAWSGQGGDEGRAVKATLTRLFFSNTISRPGQLRDTPQPPIQPCRIVSYALPNSRLSFGNGEGTVRARAGASPLCIFHEPRES